MPVHRQNHPPNKAVHPQARILESQLGGLERPRDVAPIAITDEPLVPGAMIAIGYLGDSATLAEDLQKREAGPRQRKPQAELVFGAKWGEAAKL